MEPNISEDMINELHQLTGAGMMRCKESLSALVEALKANINRPRKTDVGYKIKIDFEEYPLRKPPITQAAPSFIRFIGVCGDELQPSCKRECTYFSCDYEFGELPETLNKVYNAYQKENFKTFSERNDDVLTELTRQMFKEFDDFLKKEFGKKFVHTEYFTTTFS